MAYDGPSIRTWGGSCRENRGSAGHTLAELIVVTMVLGIILSIVISRTGTAIQHAQVNRAARVVSMDLRLAFSLAARQRRPVRITYNPDQRVYTFIDARNGTVFHTRDLGAGSEFELTSMEVSAPTFEIAPSGFASTGLTLGRRAWSQAKTSVEDSRTSRELVCRHLRDTPRPGVQACPRASQPSRTWEGIRRRRKRRSSIGRGS